MFKIIRRLKNALRPELISADLSSLFENLNPENSFSDRMIALGHIMDWVRLPINTTSSDQLPQFVHSRDVRLKFLFNFVERNPEHGSHLANTLKELIVPGGAVSLYCLTGMTENHGFFNELINRLVQKVLPESFTERDLAEAFKFIFTTEEDAVWLESSYKNNSQLITHFLHKYDISGAPLKNDLLNAMVILAAQLAATGTNADIRKRLENKKLSESNFLKLNAMVNSRASDDDLLKTISDCRLDLVVVRGNIEASGVSVDLIFKLEKLMAILDRMEMLIYLGKEYGPNASLILGQFVGRLIRDELKTLGVKSYIRENIHLLTRKIVERAGDRGAHYIANTKEERQELFRAATWAGILTSFTAMFKFMIGIQPLPLFFEGFFYFINYAFSFLIMQKWHLALSSKQPAFTACVLSKSFEDFKRTKNYDEVGTEIKKIMHSQWLTTLGNIAWVVPCCICIDWLWLTTTGEHLMSKGQAYYMLQKHHPLKSLTIPYAFMTGIFLWFSSVIGGWIENWIVFRELPELIKQSNVFKRLFSKAQLQYIADHFPGTAGGIGANLSIAFMMSVPIIIQKFTLFPIDIRHVTLSAGTVTFAFNALNWDVHLWPLMLTMIFSISIIGLLNFSVSFYFAIMMAATARDLEKSFVKKLVIRTFRFMRKA